MACLSEIYFTTVDTDWDYDGQEGRGHYNLPRLTLITSSQMLPIKRLQLCFRQIVCSTSSAHEGDVPPAPRKSFCRASFVLSATIREKAKSMELAM